MSDIGLHGANSSAGEPGVTEDALLGGKVLLRQPREGFRTAIDTVLLAAAVPALSGERVLEFGAGCGGAALCLARRVDGLRIAGIELQPELVRLAGENIRANGFDGSVDIMRGDVAGPLPPRIQGPFDHVMFNPPFLDSSRGRPSADASRTAANIEGEAGLQDWVSRGWALLRPKGMLTMIHRADRLDDVIACLHGRFGAIALYPLWPRAGQPAKRIVVRARRGVASPAAMLAGLVLHECDGRYTAEADAVLRGGPLEF